MVVEEHTERRTKVANTGIKWHIDREVLSSPGLERTSSVRAEEIAGRTSVFRFKKGQFLGTHGVLLLSDEGFGTI